MKSLFLTAACFVLCFSGCRVVTVQEYQQLQTPESPYLSKAAEIFDNELTPQIVDSAKPLGELLAIFDRGGDFAEICREYGYRQSEDLQCNFSVKVEGMVVEVKSGSRRGTITVETPYGQRVKVQTGPVITGTALRDIHKKISYIDFNDQTVYGEYGDRINARSVEKYAESNVKEGSVIEIYGAFSSWDIPSPSSIQIAPVKTTVKE